MYDDAVTKGKNKKENCFHGFFSVLFTSSFSQEEGEKRGITETIKYVFKIKIFLLILFISKVNLKLNLVFLITKNLRNKNAF